MDMTISGGIEQPDQQWRELDQQIEEGLSELTRGDGLPGEQVFQELREKSQKRRADR